MPRKQRRNCKSKERSLEFSSKELRTVGNYSIGRLIGKGSFGKVYLATHKLTNGSKVVLKSAQKDDANLAREIHHHRQLVHPHIARLYEVIVTESLVWLVLEYCPGDELYNYLIQHGRLTVDKTKRIFAQLVGAVAYVHMNNCVHRDLKLENILLDKHENVKLCDFGFTREYERNKLLQTFCGTVCYSAPEMIKGEKYIAYAVDVWSLGVILYALLVGELPFDEDIEEDTRRKILNDEPRYPDHLSEDSVSMLKSCLAKKPSLRPTLDEILSHPFIAEHAPVQKAILALQHPAPFSSKLEKDTLHRMKAAGVDIDQVIEHVLAKKCDSLAGWWALLIEKEERKEKRRQKRKIESRRMSAASNLDPSLLPPPAEEAEDRVRNDARNTANREFVPVNYYGSVIILPERNFTKSPRVQTPPSPTPPPPIEKDRDYGPSSGKGRPNRKHALMTQLASIKHWFLDSAKRATSPNSKNQAAQKPGSSQGNQVYQQQQSGSRTSNGARRNSRGNGIYSVAHRSTPPPKRNSLSPQPLTPHAYRRSSGRGLGGRTSTSSSVSSIRSFHNKTHSKASSTSSASLNSITLKSPRSPRNSIKVLPSTPTSSTFPSHVRVVRSTGYNEAAVLTNGVTFARRKKSPFKGPMLTGLSAKRDGNSAGSRQERKRSRGGIIEEEEEEEDIEEVLEFVGPGEIDGEVVDSDDDDTLRGRHG
ncbi:uncharacterized protein LAJ45_10379 [Morchella importuna]|uniref:uncharacterized protein n=1 Tax=Morchella importuna TaxID=1174673 RepID=UPI001E8E64F7|nr:uncharacterized protein LAJ45_10379 [Morchella importuna]KAH8145579.1 hypothetical protein LAJ45_10379 [Morchella importuna]